jgi:hypothetical protein
MERHLWTWYGDKKEPGTMDCTCGFSGKFPTQEEGQKAHAAHLDFMKKTAALA